MYKFFFMYIADILIKKKKWKILQINRITFDSVIQNYFQYIQVHGIPCHIHLYMFHWCGDIVQSADKNHNLSYNSPHTYFRHILKNEDNLWWKKFTFIVNNLKKKFFFSSNWCAFDIRYVTKSVTYAKIGENINITFQTIK